MPICLRYLDERFEGLSSRTGIDACPGSRNAVGHVGGDLSDDQPRRGVEQDDVTRCTPLPGKDGPDDLGRFFRGIDGQILQPPAGEPNMEASKPKGWTRPNFFVPKDVTNIALGKEVTVSDEPSNGDVATIVDGIAESFDDDTLDLGFGPVWVTVDLGKQCEIFAVLMWHKHNNIFAFRDVIVETADDKDFIMNKNVLFNNDHDGSLGKGHPKGTDKQYLETYEGKLLDAKGVRGRYVRFWSNGNTADSSTYWLEAQVFGRAVK